MRVEDIRGRLYEIEARLALTVGTDYFWQQRESRRLHFDGETDARCVITDRRAGWARASAERASEVERERAAQAERARVAQVERERAAFTAAQTAPQ